MLDHSTRQGQGEAPDDRALREPGDYDASSSRLSGRRRRVHFRPALTGFRPQLGAIGQKLRSVRAGCLIARAIRNEEAPP